MGEKYTFSELLRQFVARADISHVELGEKLGSYLGTPAVHRNTVGKWIRGDRYPGTRRKILALAAVLHLEEEEKNDLLEAHLGKMSAEGQEGGNDSSGASLSLAISRYTKWVEKTTAEFLVPNLGVLLPIEDAWIQLQTLSAPQQEAHPQTLEAYLASYHEWENLSSQLNAYAAQDIFELSHRAVVLGGPGSGKSTLCQRTAHRLAASGERVLRIRLPLARIHLEHGKTFDEAIVALAAESSGIPMPLLQNELNEPDCLLADGLDECDTWHLRIAQLLHDWAFARPHSRVVVTSRPIGYNPAFFAGWTHAELLPLSNEKVNEYVSRIITLAADPKVAAQKIHQFQLQIDTNPVASLAARNPLLLGFLVQLALADIPFAYRRAALYDQVLELWRFTAPKEREFKVPDLDAVLAHRSLDIIGWLLQHASIDAERRSERRLTGLLAEELAREMGTTGLAEARTAKHCLSFWEERGVLEHVRMGHEDAYTFVHSALAEYTAGRFASSMGEAKLREWLECVHCDVHWREPILLAAGTGADDIIVEQLLALDSENDPVKTDCLLAVSALTEAASPSPHLAQLVAERIGTRLVSSIPLIAYECAEHATGLATRFPALLVPFLQPLFWHPQIWTRLSAMRLALAAGDVAVDYNALEACLDEQLAPEDVPLQGSAKGIDSEQGLREYILYRPMPEWEIWNEVVRLGAVALARKRPGRTTAERLKRLVCFKKGKSFLTDETLLDILAGLGYATFVQNMQEKRAAPISQLIHNRGEEPGVYRAADRVLLEEIIRVAAPDKIISYKRRKLVALALFMKGLGLPDFGPDTWIKLGKKDDLLAVDAVFTGAIAALQIDQDELAKDAVWALSQFESLAQAEYIGSVLLNICPDLPGEPDWNRAASIHLPAADVVRALHHPSHAIAHGAAELLSAGAGGSEADSLLDDVLAHGDDYALRMVAGIALSRKRNEDRSRLLNRLEGELSHGCRWLLRVLPYLPGSQSDERTLPALLRGLLADDPHVALAAAETLQVVKPVFLAPVVPQLRNALTSWMTRGDYCERHQKYVQGICPDCESLPLCPRATIIKILAPLHTLGLQELLDLCRDAHPAIWQVASEEVAKILSSHLEDLTQTIHEVARGHCPMNVFDAILRLPADKLMIAQDALLALLSSKSIRVRQSMVDALATAEWLSKEGALEQARKALGDSEPAVRDQAVLTLRLLECSNETEIKAATSAK